MTSYYTPLRTLGAQVRRVLLDNAARKLGVPVDELTTEPSVVVHAKSGRKLSYGDIAAFAELPAKAPAIRAHHGHQADDAYVGRDRINLRSERDHECAGPENAVPAAADERRPGYLNVEHRPVRIRLPPAGSPAASCMSLSSHLSGEKSLVPKC